VAGSGDPEPAQAAQAAGTEPAQAAQAAGTEPAQAGHAAGTEPAQAAQAAGTEPAQAGHAAGTPLGGGAGQRMAVERPRELILARDMAPAQRPVELAGEHGAEAAIGGG
jgi:hypothetical protein